MFSNVFMLYWLELPLKLERVIKESRNRRGKSKWADCLWDFCEVASSERWTSTLYFADVNGKRIVKNSYSSNKFIWLILRWKIDRSISCWLKLTQSVGLANVLASSVFKYRPSCYLTSQRATKVFIQPSLDERVGHSWWCYQKFQPHFNDDDSEEARP